MALTILNNIAALAAQNQLNITSNNLTSTLEQLSSGSRINSGADDPAGLAIANGLEANIAALTQSASNATDGVGELQVADGALSQVTTLLNRAVTLATESATGTVSNSQRAALDSEYQSIKAEIDSIGSTTNFNGGQVFTTNTLNVFLSDGSTSGSSTIGVSTGLLSSSSLNLGGATAATGSLTQAPGTAAVAATNTLTGAAFTESAVAAATLTAGAGPANNDTITLNGQTYTFKTTLTGAANEVALGGSETAALANLASAVNASPGGAGTAYGNGTVANTGLKATGSTGTTITFNALTNGLGGNSLAYSSSGANFGAAGTLAGGTAGSTVAVGGKTYTFVAALSTTPTANEVVASNEATGLTNLALAVNQGPGAGTVYGVGTTQNANVTAGTATGTTLLFTANTPGSAGNFITGTASAGSFGTLDFAGGADTGAAPIATAGDTISVGGQQYTFVSALSTTPVANQILVGSTEAASLTNLANAVNGGTGSGATYSSNTVTNTVASAVAAPTSVVFTALTKGLAGNSIATSQTGSAANTFTGSVLTGGAAGSVNDLLTQSDATAALTLINDSVATVAALRGNIGATVNRLQSASNVITNQVENLTSAENDVTAADIPTAVANLTQFSILEQTGISALSQANQQQQLVLKLLQ